MSTYYETWINKSETITDQNAYSQYINFYYVLEKDAYDKILGSYPNNSELLKGKASEIADRLGFSKDTMDVFVGFLDGIKESIKNEMDVTTVGDDTEIFLDIDYDKLFIKMREAKATRLFKLPSWKKVFDEDKLAELNREYRDANIAHAENIGRNDPCPCGSGKKYKKCCGAKKA